MILEMSRVLYIVPIMLLFAGSISGARILGVFPINSNSHFTVYESMMSTLAEAGHEVTLISSFPQKASVANLTFIKIPSGFSPINAVSFDDVKNDLQKFQVNMNFITTLSRQSCELSHSNQQVKNLLKGNKFDLVFTEIFGADCDVGFAWKFNAPLISVVSSNSVPWSNLRVGNPTNPSYMPTMHVNYPPKMTFYQRLYNTMCHLYYITNYDNGEETDKISRNFFGQDIPPASEIVRNTSLIFVNSHYTISGAYPLVPNVIEIAGIHIKEPKPLSKDLKKFMDEAKHGVIYFTLGSLVRVSTLPKEAIKAFKDVFSKLPQRVLWKFEGKLDDIPENVLISDWFPQGSILQHPNLKLFVSHGGHLSAIEAVYYSVPIVGIPLFFDQHRNIQQLVDRGVAITLSIGSLNTDNITLALKTILTDRRYEERMKVLSNQFKDRPLKPSESIVYWTEYVLRHKGAHHLRSAAADMPWYQYLLLDVLAFLFLIFYFIYYLFRRLVLCLFGSGGKFKVD